jgi:hypothetical protein
MFMGGDTPTPTPTVTVTTTAVTRVRLFLVKGCLTLSGRKFRFVIEVIFAFAIGLFEGLRGLGQV